MLWACWKRARRGRSWARGDAGLIPSRPCPPPPPWGDISADGLGGPRGPTEASRTHCGAVSVVAASPAPGAEAVQTRGGAARAVRTLGPRCETSAWVHRRENPLPCSGGQESLAPLPVRPVGGTGVTARPPPPRCLPSPWGQDPLGAPGLARVPGKATGTAPVPLSLSPPPRWWHFQGPSAAVPRRC